MAEISQNVYLHRPIINQFRLQNNEREIVEQKQQILKNNLSLTDFGSNKCINNNNFLNNNNLIDNRNSSEHLNSLRRKEPLHLYSTSSTPPSSSSSQSTVAPIHASQMNDIKIFNTKSELQMHTQAHMREAKPYKCTQCTKTFANSSYLSQHTRIHLGVKPYRCEICQRKFTQLSHLQQHIRTHTGDKPYKCRHVGCTKQFSQLSNLQSHSRCHATDKPFKCNACYKCFVDEAALLDHIPKHKESKHLKTHICQYCGKSYTQETYLQKHLQKHIERAEKRAAGMTTSTPSLTIGRNPNNSEHNYWPKVSPDSAALFSDTIQQQQQQLQQQQQQQQFDFVINHQQQNHLSDQLQNHHLHQRASLELLHRNNSASTHSASDDAGEDLVIRENPNHQIIVTTQSNNNQHAPSTSAYDAATKVPTNSAFTPINVMTPHINSLAQHHQLTQRPIYYADAIAFQNKNVPQSTVSSFPNQLISLHQIRNYAHQPSGLMTSEHLINIGAAAQAQAAAVIKEKGQ